MVIVRVRERLLELRHVEVDEGSGNAAVPLVCLVHEGHVLSVLERHANLVAAVRPSEQLLCHEHNEIVTAAGTIVDALVGCSLRLIDPPLR